MATTYTWAVNTLDRELADGYVSTVHYTVNAADDTYSAGAYGSVGLERPESLIPYADLTESQVIGWISTGVGTTSISNMKTEIDKHIDPNIGGTPW